MKYPHNCLETQGITICKVLKKSLKSKINGALSKALQLLAFKHLFFVIFRIFTKKTNRQGLIALPLS